MLALFGRAEVLSLSLSLSFVRSFFAGGSASAVTKSARPRISASRGREEHVAIFPLRRAIKINNKKKREENASQSNQEHERRT